MPFLELTLRCTETTQPRYENALEDLGALSVTLLDADASRAKRAAVVDKMAAAYILQGALDRLGRLGPQEADDDSQYD